MFPHPRRHAAPASQPNHTTTRLLSVSVWERELVKVCLPMDTKALDGSKTSEGKRETGRGVESQLV